MVSFTENDPPVSGRLQDEAVTVYTRLLVSSCNAPRKEPCVTILKTAARETSYIKARETNHRSLLREEFRDIYFLAKNLLHAVFKL